MCVCANIALLICVLHAQLRDHTTDVILQPMPYFYSSFILSLFVFLFSTQFLHAMADRSGLCKTHCTAKSVAIPVIFDEKREQ